MIDPGVWIELCFTQDETDEAFLGLFGETVREVLPGVEGV